MKYLVKCRGFHKIDELGQNSANESQSVSAAAEEQLASMEEIAFSESSLGYPCRGFADVDGRVQIVEVKSERSLARSLEIRWFS